jgi:Ca2+-binding RTX toxin-like protein
MHSITPARKRSTRRAVFAAVLPATLLATAVPAVAEANFVILERGQLTYEQQTLANTSVTARMANGAVRIQSSDGIRGHTTNCQRIDGDEVSCPDAAVQRVLVQMGGGRDTVEYRLPHPGTVLLGAEQDTLVAGTRQAIGRALQPVAYSGGSGTDLITYANATAGVRLTPEDGLANDGRSGDQENVLSDFENMTGSNFGDPQFFGTAGRNTMTGLEGNDAIAGGGGDDVFVATVADGADDYHGGPHVNGDTISYETRTQALTVDLDNVNDDGQTGERDNVRSNVENFIGGSGVDTVFSLGAFSRLEGRGGNDKLFGGFGPDTLIGGAGSDLLDAGSHVDNVQARDGETDDINCGSEFDTISKDSFEASVVDCP